MNPNFRLNSEQLAFAVGPFAYEFVPARTTGKYRLHDSKDNAVGSAETEAGAAEAVQELNGRKFGVATH